MKLLGCLAFLALASCAAAHLVTLTLWGSETFEKSYTQILLVPEGATLDTVMTIAAMDGNTFFGWNYISSNPDSAYLNISGIVDSTADRKYWIPFGMTSKPTPCNQPASSDQLSYDITQTVVQSGMNYLLWYIFVS